MLPTLSTLKSAVQEELNSILHYWVNHSVDDKNGGFIGQIDCNETKQFETEKGAVLNARILWTFSAAYPFTNNPAHLDLADRAFQFIDSYFYDSLFGGIFWSIHPDGSPKDTKNQIYALAFTIYGLTEYYKISKKEEALQLAINLYHKIEKHSYDKEKNGYFEAFTREWQPIEDLRLSEKDANEKKTMNTHLHIVEAYANLYEVWPDKVLKSKITNLLIVIDIYFIDSQNFHLKLFFDENWIEKEDVISYGHDIEAAWLLQWCAETIDDITLINTYQTYAVAIANATKEGLDSDGGLWYEYDPKKKELIAEKHWWPQAELWIGMVNAWQLTQDETYLNLVEENFIFVQNHLIDKKNGEWFWGVYSDYSKIEKDKAGFWKCPYHNGRACLELLKRL
ncbi:N-acyl-D-glucosamine 2-epimerase [Flavobacterium jejuense]|uniref:Cellobiose 2-epimerase n=1 Tax=Flavobacterium jejuense TaxID=1544455 RepID=A0ABX0IYG8_9FLAO|nr:AGE family epimerase/isomerase [Flavobacterium jejuense]NHN27777.1 N-acyl-D-glucosamine 2-epimerase [Flavobacterium jejuense]